MIALQDVEITVCASGLLEFDHSDFPAPVFFRALSPSAAAAFKASRNSQPVQCLRAELAGRRKCAAHSSQNLSSTTSKPLLDPFWVCCAGLAVFMAVILGLLQGGH
jgi:hypothetical protein